MTTKARMVVEKLQETKKRKNTNEMKTECHSRGQHLPCLQKKKILYYAGKRKHVITHNQ